MLIAAACIIGVLMAAVIILSLRIVQLRQRLDKPAADTGPAAPVQGIPAELQTVFDSITDNICIIDQDYGICNANASYSRTVGMSGPAECIGKKCYELFRGLNQHCPECPAAGTFANGRPVMRRKEVLRRGMEDEKHIEVSAFPVLGTNGAAVKVIEYIRDVTDDARMLNELIRSEKLAGVGVMTSGIAHEMNNALSGISGTTSNLLTMPEKFGLNEKGVNRVLSIMDSATRATAVMKNLLQFSTPMREETRVMVNIRQLIKKIVSSVYIQEAPDIERHMSFEEALPPIKADLSKIELVLTNVVANALRSINERKILASKKPDEYKGLFLATVRTQNGSMVITITDNGVGIPEKARSKIFDPFFSTWPAGAGTGLGLSTALHIVEEHGGRISFDCIGDVTTFTISLPIDPATQPPSAPQPGA